MSFKDEQSDDRFWVCCDKCDGWYCFTYHELTAIDGRLSNVPNTTTAISSLTDAKLREILNFHEYPIAGTNDQLGLWVYLLKHHQTAAITSREEDQIKDFIDVFRLLILAQKKLHISRHTYQKWTYPTKYCDQWVSPTDNITLSNVQDLFQPLIKYLQELRKVRMDNDKNCMGKSAIQ